MTSTAMTGNAIREALEPCPFCGDKHPQIEVVKAHSHGPIASFMPDHPGSAFISCTSCEAMMTEISEEAVIAAWNRRARTAYDAIGSRVKALEWNEHGPCDILARTAFGGYRVWTETTGKVLLSFAGICTEAASIDEAKAAAQADFERRVHSCLSTHTDAGGRTRLDLGNLLAIIHRDGGPYELEHGTAKAVEEAHRIIGELLDHTATGAGPVGEAVARAPASESRPLIAENRWHLGAMNDGLFIIDKAPGLTTDAGPWNREDGPGMVLNVVALTHDQAKAIVDAHNSAIAAMITARPVEEPDEVDALPVVANPARMCEALNEMLEAARTERDEARRDNNLNLRALKEMDGLFAKSEAALAETRERLGKREDALREIASLEEYDVWTANGHAKCNSIARAALKGDA